MALQISQPVQHVRADIVESMTPPEARKPMLSKPTVSFKSSVEVRGVLHIEDYSREEVAASWYNRKELRAIKKEVITTVRIMESGDRLLPHDGLCSRGLESFTSDGNEQKKIHRLEAKDAVLDEQDYQYEYAIYDPDFIADVYFAKTRRSQALAKAMGRADEVWVRMQDVPQSQKKAPHQIKGGIILPSRSHLRLRRVSSSAA